MQSILQNKSNWGKEMRFLVPSMANYVIAVIYKYPGEFINDAGNLKTLQEIVSHLMQPDVRMETTGMQMVSAIFEKLAAGAPLNDSFMNAFLLSVFQSLHFYRNNTKAKIIPITISKAIWSCLATFIIYQGAAALLSACDKIQPGILFMVLKSEGEKIRHLTGPPSRERKYGIIAYT